MKTRHNPSSTLLSTTVCAGLVSAAALLSPLPASAASISFGGPSGFAWTSPMIQTNDTAHPVNTPWPLDNGDHWKALIHYFGNTDYLAVSLYDIDQPGLSALTLRGGL